MQEGLVRFSVNGEWLTGFIRDRFLYENADYDWAISVLSEMLRPNGLSPERIEQITQDIILGRSYIKGQTNDGSFVYCDCSDEPLKSDFFRKYTNLRDGLKKEEQARKDSVEAWQELALVLKGEIDRDDCMCQCNIDLLRPTPTEEFNERMIELPDNVAPYGFISPDGEFHSVDWADHEEYACNYMNSHGGFDEVLKESPYYTAKDYLVLKLGWLLLHNPRQGKPILTHGDKPMTKAQRESLFDYYTKYGMKNEANALFQEQ